MARTKGAIDKKKRKSRHKKTEAEKLALRSKKQYEKKANAEVERSKGMVSLETFFAVKKGAHDAPSHENQASGRADDDESSIASSSGESLSIASKRGTPKCR